MTVKITKDRVPDLLKAIKELTSKEVLVGIPAENAGRQDSPINNAEIAYVQEFGSAEQNIPPRPFLLPGIKRKRDKIESILRRGAVKAIAGDVSAAGAALTEVGLIADASVKAVMHSNVGPPLSPKTIYNRRHRKKKQKNTRENTLVDTTDLINHVMHVVRKKGE